MGIDQPKAIPSVVTMKLDSEDYENIYLRVRGKMWKQIWGAVALAGLGVAGAGWVYMSKLTEKAITQYVQSDVFKNGVRADALSRISDLEKHSQALEDLIKQQKREIGSLAQLPLAVTESGLSLVDPEGHRFSVEMGVAGVDEDVKFSNAYKSPPIVLVALIDDEKKRPIGQRQQNPVAFVSKVTLSGFHMEASTQAQMWQFKYRWIAIGG